MMAAVDENTLGGYFLPAFAIPSNEPGNFMIGSIITKFVTKFCTSNTISWARLELICQGDDCTVKILSQKSLCRVRAYCLAY